MNAVHVARPPADLVDAYRALGVVAIANREGVDRHQVRRWLQAAGVELDGARRGNIAQRRPCPADFRESYIRLGMEGCKEHYRTRMDNVRRWRDEAGRDELREARAAHLRKADTPAYPVRNPAKFVAESEASRAAAHWLRYPRNGGWLVGRRQRDGMYFVGSMPMTADQMIAFAEKRGWKGRGR